MQQNQDWCLQCGAGTPSSLEGGGAGWLSPAVLLIATAALVLGAAAASYAAWGKSSSSPAPVTTTVAQAPAPPASTPAIATTSTTTTTRQPVKLPKTTIKPPKIPLTAVTPKTTSTTTTTTSEQTTTTTTTTTETLPEPVLLDTNAASTYDPNNYPPNEFGDPTLAIDGDTATGWTAEVNPALAPKLGAGLEIDLKAPQRISSAELITASLGITVQVFGANPSTPENGSEPTAPTSISDPAWVKLSKTVVVKKHHVHIKFLHPGLPYRFIVLWIRFVPASDVGTAESPGRVSINELELFPASQ
jgi:hypothetical protein